MYTYHYHLFLRHPETKECIAQTITVEAGCYMSANELFNKLAAAPEHFHEGYTLVALNVGEIVNNGEAHADS